MKAFIYDCEIINAIPPKDDSERIDGIGYVDGWGSFDQMGIGVLAYQWLNHSSPRYFIGDKTISNKVDFFLDFFQAVVRQADLVIGFNSKSFDDKLLRANGIEIQTHYDLLEEIRIAANGSPRSTPRGYSYKLDYIAKANGLEGKSMMGSHAPIEWQRGNHQMVCSYCVDDVRITKTILELGLNGELVDPNTGKHLKLRDL